MKTHIVDVDTLRGELKLGTIEPNMGAKNPSSAEPMAAALFGAARQAVLGLLFAHSDERFYQRQIVRHLGRGHGGIQRELRRLSRCGILTRTIEG